MKITFYTAPARYARMNQYSIVLDGIIFIGAIWSGPVPWIQGGLTIAQSLDFSWMVSGFKIAQSLV